MIGLSMIVLFNLFSVPQKGEKEIIFSEFLAKVDAGEVDESRSRKTTSPVGSRTVQNSAVMPQPIRIWWTTCGQKM